MWEAKLLPPIKGELGGYSMTQEYYTNYILPVYIYLIYECRLCWLEQNWWL